MRRETADSAARWMFCWCSWCYLPSTWTVRANRVEIRLGLCHQQQKKPISGPAHFIFIFYLFIINLVHKVQKHTQTTHSTNNVESAESANSAIRCSKQTQLNCQSLSSAKSCHLLKCMTHAQKNSDCRWASVILFKNCCRKYVLLSDSVPWIKSISDQSNNLQHTRALRPMTESL